MIIKIPRFCGRCSIEAERLGKVYDQPEIDYSVELNDEGVYEHICPKGHSNWTTLEHQKFEILFDIGVLALSESYTRESVSSFATSIERFYEFIINVILFKSDFSIDEQEQFWKKIANSSERQYGAFISLYLTEYKEIPEVIPNKWIEFRNNVVHKGHFPSLEKSIEYGEFVLKYFFNTLKKIRKKYGKETALVFWKTGLRDLALIKKHNPKVDFSGSLITQTIINLGAINFDNYGNVDFREKVKALSKNDGVYRLYYEKQKISVV